MLRFGRIGLALAAGAARERGQAEREWMADSGNRLYREFSAAAREMEARAGAARRQLISMEGGIATALAAREEARRQREQGLRDALAEAAGAKRAAGRPADVTAEEEAAAERVDAERRQR